jgi:phosphohistidine phosphatase
MRTLFLVRHAKSGHDAYVPIDIHRHLSPRGYSDAALAGAFLKSKGLTPDKIISSPAVRTWSTALIIAQCIDYPVAELEADATIYEAPLGSLLKAVNRVDKQFGSLMLVGHNPGMTLLTNYLCGNVITSFPTAAIACISIPEAAAWNEVSGKTASLEWMFEVQ